MTTKKPKSYKRKIYSNPKKFISPEKKRNARKMGYDKDWDIYRWRFLHRNPKCYTCGFKATVVDHAIAHKGDVKLFEDTANHLPLCKRCHDTITARFDRYNPPKIDDKNRWIINQRVRNHVTSKVVRVLEYRKTKDQKPYKRYSD